MKKGASFYFGLTLFLAIAAGVGYLFYLGGYSSFLSGDSSSFMVELARAQARAHPDAAVIVFGNSTAAEDFRPNFFNARAKGNLAVNLGVPGGYVYLYDRLLAMAARAGIRPRVVILTLTPDVLSDRPDLDFMLNDLTMLKTLLDFRDLFHLAAYSRDLREYAALAGPVVARPVLFRADIQSFLAHPVQRFLDARKIHEWLNGFGRDSEMQESNHTFSVCDAGPLDDLPAAIERLRRENSPLLPDFERLQLGYFARLHQPLEVDEIHIARLRHVLQKFARTHASVYLVPAPFYDPGFNQYPSRYRLDYSAALSQIAKSIPGVTLLDDFEADCTMMMDTVHLNRKGGERFTEYLRTRVL